MNPEQPAPEPLTLDEVPLGEAVQAVRDGDPWLEAVLVRIAPHDGSLLVAASFNSSI